MIDQDHLEKQNSSRVLSIGLKDAYLRSVSQARSTSRLLMLELVSILTERSTYIRLDHLSERLSIERLRLSLKLFSDGFQFLSHLLALRFFVVDARYLSRVIRFSAESSHSYEAQTSI